MVQFLKRKQFRLLLVTNVITAAVLIIVLISENYHSKLYYNFFRTKKADVNYAANINFQNYYSVNALYKEQKNIVMLGNSLTQFAHWNELLNRPDVANRGIGGDLTSGFIARLRNVIVLKPKICFIEGGINDLNRDISNSTIVKNLKTIINTLQSNNIKPVLTTVSFLAAHYKVKDPLEQNKKIKELNKSIVQLSIEENIDHVDLNQYISNDEYLDSEFASKDGIHFTGNAYIIWKREVEKILETEDLL